MRRLAVVVVFAALCILFVANCVPWWLPLAAVPVLVFAPELIASRRAA